MNNYNMLTARVYWITGLSGSGKTTIGSALYNEIKYITDKVIYLDGDEMRENITNDLGYTFEDRKVCAFRYSGLCKMLSNKGFIVICTTISMFDEVREWNRNNIDNYIEVFIDVTKETLLKRNQKDMYSNNEKNMIGIDIKAELPKYPDIIIENSNGDIEKIVSDILKFEVT